MRDIIKKILKEETESNQLDMINYWKNSPKVTDVDNTEQMDDFMWHIIDYVDFPSDGDNRRINKFIMSLIRYGFIDIEFYMKMYRWLKRKLADISIAEEDFQMSLYNVGGDDSYSDWLWHVLSLGKENFERLKEGYDDTIEDMEELNPIESFNYAWPHPYDFRDD